MIRDDHAEPGGLRASDRLDGGNTTVTRHDQRGADAFGFGQPGRTEVVTIRHAMGQERMDVTTRDAQRARQHRSRTLAVHIVVAVHQDALPSANRRRDHVDRCRHASECAGVGQRIEPRAQERSYRTWFVVSALHQKRGERQR